MNDVCGAYESACGVKIMHNSWSQLNDLIFSLAEKQFVLCNIEVFVLVWG